jgi:catechol 2,3-dioxygenase-like lactoylglutathione lyase family enzyme
MFNITHMRSISLRSTKIEQCKRFYAGPWGLKPVPADSGRALFKGTGTEHHVLEIIDADDTGLDTISFAVSTPEEVDLAAQKVKDAGFEVLQEPGWTDATGGGYRFQAKDVDGNRVEISSDLSEQSAVAEHPELPGPIDHLVLNTPNVDAMISFYTEVLGLQVSDWYEKQAIIFLRCNDDHHCLAIAISKVTGIQHLAFRVYGLEAVMRSVGRMRMAGLDPIWGPGRHGPGGNVFTYFADPNGYVVEFTTDQFKVDENSQPKEWARTVENADVWGSAGGPTETVLKLWSGKRDDFVLETRKDSTEWDFT